MSQRIPTHIRELAERSVKHARTGQTLKMLSSFILGLDQELADLEEVKRLHAEVETMQQEIKDAQEAEKQKAEQKTEAPKKSKKSSKDKKKKKKK